MSCVTVIVEVTPAGRLSVIAMGKVSLGAIAPLSPICEATEPVAVAPSVLVTLIGRVKALTQVAAWSAVTTKVAVALEPSAIEPRFAVEVT